MQRQRDLFKSHHGARVRNTYTGKFQRKNGTISLTNKLQGKKWGVGIFH
jgi:hypothetical protein